MTTEDRPFPIVGYIGVVSHVPFWNHLAPGWLRLRLGWRTCGRCGRTHSGVLWVRKEGENLCARCWALFVYFPRVAGTGPWEDGD